MIAKEEAGPVMGCDNCDLLNKRIEELKTMNDEENENYTVLHNKNKRLESDNLKLRECVEFYADHEGQRWGTNEPDGTAETCTHMVAEVSGGAFARSCLASLLDQSREDMSQKVENNDISKERVASDDINEPQ